MNTKQILTDMNSAQKKAIKNIDGPSIILAGAGSGKTRVLTYKAAYMIDSHKINPQHILMVTFTNKAATEMKNRMFAYSQTQLGFVGTFHSFGALLLRRYGKLIDVPSNFVIFDEDDKTSILKKIIKEIQTDRKIMPQTLSNKISSAKDNLIDEKEYMRIASNQYEKSYALGYTLYQKTLNENNAVDFDDLLCKSVYLLRKNPSICSRINDSFRYIMVDEFQDTNTAQYILCTLFSKHTNITVVGDFSQSIYSWRGAEIANLEKFQHDFPQTKIFHLTQNYRSTKNILDYAYNVIIQNTSHPVLELFTEDAGGEEVEVIPLESGDEEAVFIAGQITKMNKIDMNNVAVLYRMNSQSRAVEEAFLHYGIPYILIGGTRFYSRREIKDIISYVRLLVNKNEKVSQERIIKIGKKRYENFLQLQKELSTSDIETISTDELIQKILQKTSYLDLFDENDAEDFARLENIKELRSVALQKPNILEFLETIALVESEYSEAEKKGSKEGVKLMTMHQAKGLEFHTVFVIGVEEGILPHARSVLDLKELEEERRLFYVAITRARKKLYITHARYRFMYGRSAQSVPSRFLHNTRDEIYYEPVF